MVYEKFYLFETKRTIHSVKLSGPDPGEIPGSTDQSFPRNIADLGIQKKFHRVNSAPKISRKEPKSTKKLPHTDFQSSEEVRKLDPESGSPAPISMILENVG